MLTSRDSHWNSTRHQNGRRRCESRVNMASTSWLRWGPGAAGISAAMLGLTHGKWAGHTAHAQAQQTTGKVSSQGAAAHKQQERHDSFLPLNEKEAKLKLVQVVFRHGARTPLSPRHDLWRGVKWDVCGKAYQPVPVHVSTVDGKARPDNEHNAKQVAKRLEGGCHAGQLTVTGQLQALELGGWLRKRYVDELGLLPPNSDQMVGALRCRTTNFERTIGTLAGVITGIMPAGARGPAVPVTTSSDVDEILYADSKQCPHLGIYMKMSKQAAWDGVRRDPEYAWAREEIKRVFGVDDTFFDKDWCFTDVHDVLCALRAAGKPVPEAVSARLDEAVNRLATKEFAPYVAPSVRDAHGHIVLRLSMGVLLHTMVTNMEEAVASGSSSSSSTKTNGSNNSSDSPRMFLYSGHDSTIMPILSALGVELHSWPPFVSNLIFELWELPADKGSPAGGAASRHVVRVLYNREELDIPHAAPGRFATLPTFRHEVIGPFLMPSDAAAAACKVPMSHDSAMPQPASMAARPDDE